MRGGLDTAVALLEDIVAGRVGEVVDRVCRPRRARLAVAKEGRFGRLAERIRGAGGGVSDGGQAGSRGLESCKARVKRIHSGC